MCMVVRRCVVIVAFDLKIQIQKQLTICDAFIQSIRDLKIIVVYLFHCDTLRKVIDKISHLL